MSRSPAAITTKRPSFDERAALRRVMELMAVPGPSGREREAVAWVRRELLAAGAKIGRASWRERG